MVWVAAVCSEFMGPFNVLHQPLYLSVVAWGLWAVPALAEAFAIVAVLDRPSPNPAPTTTSSEHVQEPAVAAALGG
jgi:hypothetical protein